MSKQQIGVVGMAVMGRNLALNIESRGYTVSIFNRSREKTEEVPKIQARNWFLTIRSKSLLNLWKRLVASC